MTARLSPELSVDEELRGMSEAWGETGSGIPRRRHIDLTSLERSGRARSTVAKMPLNSDH